MKLYAYYIVPRDIEGIGADVLIVPDNQALVPEADKIIKRLADKEPDCDVKLREPYLQQVLRDIELHGLSRVNRRHLMPRVDT